MTMIPKETLDILMENHGEVYDYIISMKALTSVETEFAITDDLLLSRAFDIVISMLENIGITVHDNSLFEDLTNATNLSNLQVFLSPSTLTNFLENNTEVHEMLNELIESNSESLLLEIFEKLQVIYINDENYKKLYDTIYWSLTNDERFVNYITNIVELVTKDDTEIEYRHNTAFYINVLSLIQHKIINESDNQHNEVNLIVDRWFSSLCNCTCRNIFGWYLLNKDNIEINESMVNEFKNKYEAFKQITYGYREYYDSNNILINDMRNVAIDYIENLDPFHNKGSN